MVFQFAISIVLFVGTFIIYTQLQYVQTKDLGFDKEETVVINRADDLSDQIQSFENELRENKAIINVTNSNAIPVTAGETVHLNSKAYPGSSLKTSSNCFATMILLRPTN